MKRAAALALLGVLAVGVARVAAQDTFDTREPLIVGADRFFRLEWQPGRSRKGQPVVEGYVYNDWGLTAERVSLLVEALDASGARVASSVGPVAGTVPPKNRAYFRVDAPPGGATYRVRVYSFNWITGVH